MIKDNLLNWFRTEFVPNAANETIAALIFLYRKYGDELLTSIDSYDFLQEIKNIYLNTPVNRVKKENKDESVGSL